jgi:hypothetical protein
LRASRGIFFNYKDTERDKVKFIGICLPVGKPLKRKTGREHNLVAPVFRHNDDKCQ